MIDVWDDIDYQLLRIMMVPVHHSETFRCVYVYMFTHVLACLSVLLVYRCACRLAWAFCVSDWTLCACQSSEWCHVSLCNKCLAGSCCVWFGTDGILSTLLINQTWYNPKETVELSGKPILCLRYEIKVFGYVRLWKPHLVKVKIQPQYEIFCLSFIKSKRFFISTSPSLVLTPPVCVSYCSYCLTPDLPHDLRPGQCGDADL